jgi:hypothetical protein
MARRIKRLRSDLVFIATSLWSWVVATVDESGAELWFGVLPLSEADRYPTSKADVLAVRAAFPEERVEQLCLVPALVNGRYVRALRRSMNWG